MFSKLALFAAATFAVFVAALPSPGGPGLDKSCDGGQVYCCDSIQSASSSAATEKSLLNALIPVGVAAGLTCTPIHVLALQKLTCTTQTTCCTGENYHGGALVLGCNPTRVSA